MGHSIFRVLNIILFFLALFFLHEDVSAQNELKAFDYSTKNGTIELAKTGHAESLFQLGLAHYHGLNASKNSVVAERFFFFAARNGNNDAEKYLQKIRQSKSISYKVRRKPANVKILNKDRSRESAGNKPREAPVLLEPAIETEKSAKNILTSVSVSNEFSDVQPKQQKQDLFVKTPQATKSSIQNKAAMVVNDNQKSTQLSLWSYVLYTAIALAIVLAFMAIYRIIFVSHDVSEIIPTDFHEKQYLDLNPDVRRAGMDAKFHYIHHGRFEGRRYKL